ncbi:unnamed protein product [Danaus chrysippus]|uniref:(African queen) hypothetical protein n=1 Tax=Danaus chrysippus TaxID=151541 RepID=A0A8J2RB49_9NEOP|nr:unnamed protein product [Danaus chrysippus]
MTRAGGSRELSARGRGHSRNTFDMQTTLTSLRYVTHGTYGCDGQRTSRTSDQDTSDQDTSDQDTSGQDTSDQDTSDQDTSDQDTSDQDTSDQDTSDQDTSDQDTSGQDTSDQDTSDQDTSDQDTSGQDTSDQDTSDQDTSDQDTSDQDTSDQDTSDQDTSDQDTSGQDTSDQDTSDQDTSDQDTSDQDTSDQDTSGQDTSDQDTSGQDTSDQDTSDQDTSDQDTSDQDTSDQDTSGLSEIITSSQQTCKARVKTEIQDMGNEFYSEAMTPAPLIDLPPATCQLTTTNMSQLIDALHHTRDQLLPHGTRKTSGMEIRVDGVNDLGVIESCEGHRKQTDRRTESNILTTELCSRLSAGGRLGWQRARTPRPPPPLPGTPAASHKARTVFWCLSLHDKESNAMDSFHFLTRCERRCHPISAVNGSSSLRLDSATAGGESRLTVNRVVTGDTLHIYTYNRDCFNVKGWGEREPYITMLQTLETFRPPRTTRRLQVCYTECATSVTTDMQYTAPAPRG